MYRGAIYVDVDIIYRHFVGVLVTINGGLNVPSYPFSFFDFPFLVDDWRLGIKDWEWGQ